MNFKSIRKLSVQYSSNGRVRTGTYERGRQLQFTIDWYIHTRLQGYTIEYYKLSHPVHIQRHNHCVLQRPYLLSTFLESKIFSMVRVNSENFSILMF